MLRQDAVGIPVSANTNGAYISYVNTIPDANGNQGAPQLVVPTELPFGEKAKRWIGNAVDEVLHMAQGIPGEGAIVGGLSRLGRSASLAEKAVDACCCFPAGTPVVTENGTTPIEKIQVGQLVRARDEKSGQMELKPVTKLFITKGKPLFQLTTRSASGVTERLEVTDNHPFWVAGVGWIDSAKLLPGMVLRDVDNAELSVVELTALGRAETTYNFTVADFHTYFAGPQRAFVHNCTCVNAAASLAKGAERGLWNMTKEGTERVMKSDQFGKMYKSAVDGLWWSKDQAGHGAHGSAQWKVFRETSKGLEWFRDADKYGDFITGKHKGPTGMLIPWNRLSGSGF